MEAAQSLAPEVGVRGACRALRVSRATYYRRQQAPLEPKARRRPPLQLSSAEVEEVLEILHSPRFQDRSPRQVWATLLDEDQRYLCSVRTMYRVLAARGESRERRAQRRHPAYAKPELLATGPNQVWSWDLSQLKGPSKGVWYYLYLVLDIFSRYVVGWRVARREQADLATELIEASVEKQGIARDQLTLHADRGPSMTSKSVALLMSRLGVSGSHSRPYTSNDNPFSEAQFKTIKYHASYPERFGSLEDAQAYFRRFIAWYNAEHRHSELALLPPSDVHYGRAAPRLERRQAVLEQAYAQHPERFKGRVPRPGQVPEKVWINPPKEDVQEKAPGPETPGPESSRLERSDNLESSRVSIPSPLTLSPVSDVGWDERRDLNPEPAGGLRSSLRFAH